MPHELLVFKGPAFVVRVPLGRAPLTLGRGAGVDVPLDGLGVSRSHARLVPGPDGIVLEDLGSAAGTRVEGRVVQRERVRAGVPIEIGEFRLYLLKVPEDPGGEAGAVEELFLATAAIAASVDLETLVSSMLDAAQRIFAADRGMVLVSDGAGGWRVAQARGLDPSGAEGAASRTVAHQAARTGKPILIADSHASRDFASASSLIAAAARSVLCAPLAHDGRCLGVVYLDGPALSRLYTGRDLSLLATFALHLGSALGALERREGLEAEARRLRQIQAQDDRDLGRAPAQLVARSPAMKRVLAELEAVAPRDTTTMILGESGTGKELLARSIHELSPRRTGPFVAVSCMALSPELAASELFGHEKGAFTGADVARPGRFELADGGTLFLDEVGELSQEMQVRLLRVLQERTFERVGSTRTRAVNVRVVAATNRDMKEAVRSGRFREDLWYRLDVFTLRVPPLRERPEDVLPLVDCFVERFGREFAKPLRGLVPEVARRLAAYSWPGNVRELRNVLERAFVLERGEWITPASLPADLRGDGASAHTSAGPGTVASPGFEFPKDFHRAKEAFERAFFERALRESGGNMTAAAETSGVPRKTIYRKLKAFGVSVEELVGDEE